MAHEHPTLFVKTPSTDRGTTREKRTRDQAHDRGQSRQRSFVGLTVDDEVAGTTRIEVDRYSVAVVKTVTAAPIDEVVVHLVRSVDGKSDRHRNLTAAQGTRWICKHSAPGARAVSEEPIGMVVQAIHVEQETSQANDAHQEPRSPDATEPPP
jgi:hypothetical protein